MACRNPATSDGPAIGSSRRMTRKGITIALATLMVVIPFCLADGKAMADAPLRIPEPALSPNERPPPPKEPLPNIPDLPDFPRLPAPLPSAPTPIPTDAPQGSSGTVDFDPPQPTLHADAPRTSLADWTRTPDVLYQGEFDPPIGFTGRSGVLPRDVQTDNHFIPMEDRWRIGFPAWDRYGNGHPAVDDYPYVAGHKWDPFNLNVLKGDYPIVGQNTFLAVTASSDALFEFRQVPIPTTPFESTANPRSYPFIGRPNQFLYQHFFTLGLDLFHGDAAFKPNDWRIKLTPIFNINYLAGEELGVVNPNVQQGVDRGRTFFSLQEWFFETKIADLGPNYDFVSVRAGSQPFTSDFRGFIFSDTNRAVRLFGSLDSNREQFNLAFFAQQEKDTNSQLNTFSDRDQRILMANVYIQDFIFPGYTTQTSVHYNHDSPTVRFDNNNFLVRPDPVGIFQPHTLDVAYLGWAGDGHIDRLNITHAFYWALGHDSLNPLANRPQDISAQMAAVELSYDRDWVRFRTSLFYSSCDRNPRNGHATGFDSIFDNPNFAGGEFSYWQRQSIRLLGVNLTNRESLVPDLRSSKTQGQSNFVNPGLQLLNFGADFEITQKLRLVSNVNCLWFDSTESLKLFTFQENIHRHIGTDISLGFEYRPLLSNNVIFKLGLAALVPGQGFRDLYNNIRVDINTMYAAFTDIEFAF
jgi:hypothetical protein